MSRLSAMVWMLAAFVASFASAGDVTVCVITKDVAPVKEFSTNTIAEDKYNTTMAAGGLLGPCSEYLGELCDDEDFCTVDYDIEDNSCYAFPRDVVDNCAQNECFSYRTKESTGGLTMIDSEL